MADLLPRYYLRHDTPAGPRFAYPASGIDGTEIRGYRPDIGNGWTWTVTTPHSAAAWSGSWLIADQPIHVLSRHRPGSRVRDGWIKRTEPSSSRPMPPEAAARFADAPERPAAEQAAHYVEHEAEHACWECAEFHAFYGAHHVQGPDVVEVQTFDAWQPLDAQLDQHPDQTWTVTDGSLLAIYGAHTAHLWPGYLTDLQEAVVAALNEHPLIGEVNHWTHKRGEISATVKVPFEPRRTRTTNEKDHRNPRRKPRPVTREVWGMERRTELHITDRVHGTSKADAVARWDDVVAREVARFVPHGRHSAVCGTCDGVGLVVTDGG